MPQTYRLTVNYTQDQVLATWDFDGEGTEQRCCVQPGDKMAFGFDGPGDIAECVLISGQLNSSCHGATPFVEGNRINLKSHSTLTVGGQDGLWGFSVSFSARNADGTTSFYYLPDPEVEVGSRA